MRAVVVLPTPRTPVSIQAWAMRPVAKALVSVRTIGSWPIRSEKFERTVFARQYAIGTSLVRSRVSGFAHSPVQLHRTAIGGVPIRRASSRPHGVMAPSNVVGRKAKRREAGTMTRSGLVRAASFRT